MKRTLSILLFIVSSLVTIGQDELNKKLTENAEFLNRRPEYLHVSGYEDLDNFKEVVYFQLDTLDSLTLVIPIFSTYGTATIFKKEGNEKKELVHKSQDYGRLLKIAIQKDFGDTLELKFVGCHSEQLIKLNKK